MADDTKKEPAASEGAAPAFDPAAFMQQVEQTVGKALDSRMQPALTYPYASPQPSQPAQSSSNQEDPLGALVRPYVESATKPLQEQVAQANLRAQMAEDRAAFYAKHPEIKPDSPMATQIESAFSKLAAAGSPFVREDILHWEIGKNFDKYRQDANTREAEERARAAAAAQVGAFGVPHAGGVQRDPYAMTDEELALAIKSREF